MTKVFSLYSSSMRFNSPNNKQTLIGLHMMNVMTEQITKMKTRVSTRISTQKRINNSVVAILLFTSMVVSNCVIAQDYTSSSFGELSINLTNELRTIIATDNKNAIADQYLGKATGKTRQEILEQQTAIAMQSALPLPTSKSLSLVRSHSYDSYESYADFSIYGATALLQDDYDNDGFYKTFTVSFDADIYSYTPNQLGEVYALLYISKNGGPWIHYYTTDDFLIEGNSPLDEYEIITSFLSGYPTDYYDILIDLYQRGYSDIVTSYSSDDSNNLYALPLESENFDEPYTETYVEVTEVISVGHGGSLSMNIIILCLLMLSVRTLHIKT